MNTACNDARAKLQDRAKSNRGPEALTGSGKERVAKSRRGCVKSQQPRGRMAKLCCSAACNCKTFRSCSLMSQTPTSTLPWRAAQTTAHFIFNQIISGLTQMANASQKYNAHNQMRKRKAGEHTSNTIQKHTHGAWRQAAPEQYCLIDKAASMLRAR